MTEERLAAIEARLAALEGLLAQLIQEASAEQASFHQRAAKQPVPDLGSMPDKAQVLSARRAASAGNPPWPTATASQASASPAAPPRDSLPSVTTLMGWTGAGALVLAVIYLIRLSVDAGWLTPSLQCMLAATIGVGLVVVGGLLQKADRVYASLLPAAGISMWFAAIYGAHLYYHVLRLPHAAWLVMLVCGVALWLGRQFNTDRFSLFALFGVYSAPFLLPALVGDVLALVLYFGSCSLLFAAYALWLPSRKVYLLSTLLSLITFHLCWYPSAPNDWLLAFSFQCLQFVLTGVVTWQYSARHQQTLSVAESVAHLPGLFVFYGLQYSLLDQHMPSLAPWMATLSAAVVSAIYWQARRQLARPLPSGQVMVGAYVAFVLLHAVYLQLIPEAWQWLCGLMVIPLYLGYWHLRPAGTSIAWPFRLLATTILSMNLMHLLFDMAAIKAGPWIMLLYVLELYAAYAVVGRQAFGYALIPSLLYLGHLGMLVAVVHLVDHNLGISFIWAAVAISCLALAFKYRDKMLGQSALFILAVSVLKAVFYDLSDSSPVMRILCLVVLGVSLYTSGLLYQRLEKIN